MRPALWQPPVELSIQEQQILKRIRRAKLFVFLRQHRHALLDEAFQQELANLYQPSKRGHPPIAPAQLALAVILQAYTGVSDDEVIEGNAHGPALAVGSGLSGHQPGTAEQEMPFVPGGVIHFPKEICAQCPLQTQSVQKGNLS